MLWLGLGLLVVAVIVVAVWRMRRRSVPELGSISEQWVADQRRK
jgi:hypothetical protein